MIHHCGTISSQTSSEWNVGRNASTSGGCARCTRTIEGVTPENVQDDCHTCGGARRLKIFDSRRCVIFTPRSAPVGSPTTPHKHQRTAAHRCSTARSFQLFCPIFPDTCAAGATSSSSGQVQLRWRRGTNHCGVPLPRAGDVFRRRAPEEAVLLAAELGRASVSNAPAGS